MMVYAGGVIDPALKSRWRFLPINSDLLFPVDQQSGLTLRKV